MSQPNDAPRKHPVYCDDWACPAKVSCRWAWLRAWPYWRFDREADVAEKVQLEQRFRNPARAECLDYERDEPRSWLRGVFDGWYSGLVEPGAIVGFAPEAAL